MKEFFDRNYYAVLDQLNGRPYGLMISAGTDGAAAVRQAERICTGWRLNAVAPPLIVKTGADTPEAIAAPKTIRPEDRALCETLRSEEHTSELQSLMRISYAVFCLKKK